MKYFSVTYRYNKTQALHGTIVNEEGLRNLSNTPGITVCCVREIWS